jgi:hypothetical protein
MVPRLTCIPFDARHLPKLQDFDCGTEDYEREVAHWIKNAGPDCVLNEMAKYPNLRVWLYVLLESLDIVGFGSLGQMRWDLSELKEDRRLVSIIPNMGIRGEFHHKPVEAVDKFDRFSSQIISDLIAKAKDGENHPDLLGLYVHPENLGAIKLYERHGFVRMKKVKWKNPDTGVYYPGMLRRLDIQQGTPA